MLRRGGGGIVGAPERVKPISQRGGVGWGEWEGDLPSARPALLQHQEFLPKQHKPAVLAAPEPLLRGCSPARLPEPRSRGRGPFVLLPLSSRAPTFLRRQRPEQPPLLCGGWDTAPEKA